MKLMGRSSVSLAAVAALAVACAGGAPPEKFEELPSAAELYKKGETPVGGA